MSERKFAKVLVRPGSAAHIRETVSKAVRTKTIYQNKSLLVECTPDVEYSTRKFFSLQRVPNSSSSLTLLNNGEIDEIDSISDTNVANLFVKECLKTYSASHLELVEETEVFTKNKSISDNYSNSSSDENNHHEATNGVEIRVRDSNGEESDIGAPPWFWDASGCESMETHLDEAGIAVEGHLHVIYKNEELGDRFIQIKWDSGDEKFWLIVWEGTIGREIITRVDLCEVEPSWTSSDKWGDKLELKDENLVFYREEKRGLLKQLFVICSKLGSCEHSASLASPVHVSRVPKIVQLFQSVSKELLLDSLKISSNGQVKTRTKSLDRGGIFFTIELHSLDFKIKTETGSPIEPYFLIISIYDCKSSRKVSEDFHCTVDINGKISTPSKGLFHVSERSEGLTIVVRVEKTLGVSSETEVYLRGNPDPKTGSRLSKTITTSPLYTTNQRYRMPVCWTARSLFRRSENCDDFYSLDTQSAFGPLYKYEKTSDEELLRLLSDFKKPEKIGKIPLVPGSISLSISTYSSLMHELNNGGISNENKIENRGINNNNNVQIVAEFPTVSLEPFSHFSHQLYVYPLVLNLAPVANRIRARNILCRVFLRAEDDIEASPLDLQPGDGSLGTFVLYHKSNPEWYSEIKIKLPVGVDSRLHLLFQFSHISCSFEKGTKGKQVENNLGWAWTPLLNKFRFIGGEHVLPIAASLPSGYLQIQPLGLGRGSHYLEDEVALLEGLSLSSFNNENFSHLHLQQQQHQVRPPSSSVVKKLFKSKSEKYSGPEINWLEKCTLSLRLLLLSTVWTKSGALGAFFAHAQKLSSKQISHSRLLACDDETTLKALRALESVDGETLRDFFPTILNQVIAVGKMGKGVGFGAFKFMLWAFSEMSEGKYEEVIEEYIRCRALATEEEKKSKLSLGEVIVDAWIELFESGDGHSISLSLTHSPHLFSLLTKSIAIESNALICSQNSSEESGLGKLLQLFTCELVQRAQADGALSKRANGSVVGFIASALCIVEERVRVFGLINAYLACFGPGDSHKVQDLKFYFLQRLVQHPLFLELNSPSQNDEDFTRLDNASWAKRNFLAATIMKQSRSGLGEISQVRTLALKPIIAALAAHEENGAKTKECCVWVAWLRVVCDNLHRISTSALSSSSSSRASSVSTLLSSSNPGTLVQAALSKSLTGSPSSPMHAVSGAGGRDLGEEGSEIGSRKSSLRVRGGMSTNSSMSNISNIAASGVSSNGDRMSLDRLSLSNCDYLDAISAIKLSNPAASTSAASTISAGSGSGTIVNEDISNSGSGDGGSMIKESSEHLSTQSDDELLSKLPKCENGSIVETNKSPVVLRRYDKLNELETSQLLLSGLYILRHMGENGLKIFWAKSNGQERGSLLHMIYLACAHFTTVKKTSTVTRKKVVGILVPPTQPPSPRSSLLPSKKWSSLPLNKGISSDSLKDDLNSSLSPSKNKVGPTLSNSLADDWKALNRETSFICVETLKNLIGSGNGDESEMRDVIRTLLDVGKTSEDMRALLSSLENLLHVQDLAGIVFAKGNEDLAHRLFVEILNGFGTSYLIPTCVAILAKLYLNNAPRTTSQSLLAISSLSLSPPFVHNFRKSLGLLERGLSLNDRSSFVMSITEKLSYIDLGEFEPKGMVSECKQKSSFRHLKSSSSGRGRRDPSHSPPSLPTRLATILNSLWLLRSSTNDYRSSELHLKLANSYSSYARGRLRIETFDGLKEEHLGRKRYSEALCCEMHVAAGLARSTATPEVKRIMLGISQNLRDEFNTCDGINEDEDSTEELIQRLETCVELCEKAERYELMLEVYRILIDIQESLSDYAALEHSYKQMSRACALIQKKRERFLATYYRVALYYPRKNKISRPLQVYVYKEPNVTSLMEICGKVEAAEGAVIISGDTDSIPDDDKIYATITHVSPIASESPRAKLWSQDFRKHQNVSQFTYDTPFAQKNIQERISVDNKAAVHLQWKRRHTIHTEYTFPSVVSRLRVISVEEEDLSPIVVAIDDMERRVIELRGETGSSDLKRIQLRLQGSVSVTVNQGPLAYARAFLDRDSTIFPPHHINRLKDIFRDFVECCGELLIRNKQLISSEQDEYQKQLELDYNKLCQTLSTILGLPESSLNRMSRISVSSC